MFCSDFDVFKLKKKKINAVNDADILVRIAVFNKL